MRSCTSGTASANTSRWRWVGAALRGAAFADLMVTPGVDGTVTGRVDLTPDQATALAQGRVYVQLHSEKAPDGNLWGWLLVAPARAGGGER